MAARAVLRLATVLRLAAVLLSMAALGHAGSRQDYCRLCSSHTMCRYAGVAAACRRGRWAHGVPRNHQQQIVDLHNNLRNKVALGHEKRGRPGPQPSAANMHKMVWDNELAQVAQRWADQCNYQHDSCRKVRRFAVGQNLYIKTQWPCSSVDNSQKWPEAIHAWYNEVAMFDRRTVNRYTFSAAVGHYTQMVWHNTRYIGCGFSLFQSGNQCKKYYVCNYGPSGNFIGQPMYKTGRARSSCPRRSGADKRYAGLC